jgi:hypothetical protein
MHVTQTPDRHSLRYSCAGLLAAATLLFAVSGCGSSSSSSQTSATTSPTGATAGASKIYSARPVAPRDTNPDVVSKGVSVHRPANGTGGDEINDDNPGGADSGHGSTVSQVNPCTLLSAAGAQAIVGRPFNAPQEAPLGPTCIYQPQGGGTFITLAVEPIDYHKVMQQTQKLTTHQIAGYTIYCGDYGQPTAFAALPKGRILDVRAQCAVGIRFAAQALAHLKQ